MKKTTDSWNQWLKKYSKHPEKENHRVRPVSNIAAAMNELNAEHSHEKRELAIKLGALQLKTARTEDLIEKGDLLEARAVLLRIQKELKQEKETLEK